MEHFEEERRKPTNELMLQYSVYMLCYQGICIKASVLKNCGTSILSIMHQNLISVTYLYVKYIL